MNNNNDNSNIPSKSTPTSFREVRLSKYYVEVLIDNSPDVLGTPSESNNLLSLNPPGNNVVNGSVINASVVNGNVINGSVENGNVVNTTETKSGSAHRNFKQSPAAYAIALDKNSKSNDNAGYTLGGQRRNDYDEFLDFGFDEDMMVAESSNQGNARNETSSKSNPFATRQKNNKRAKRNSTSPNQRASNNENAKGIKTKRGGAISKIVPSFDEEQVEADLKHEIARKQQKKFNEKKKLVQATNKVSNLREELDHISNEIEFNNERLFEWTYGFKDLNFHSMSVRDKRRRKSKIIKNLNNNIANLSFEEDCLKKCIKRANKRKNKIQKKVGEIESRIASDIHSYNYNFK